ncbi:MAG TPA: hypothetical protein VFG33_20865 [Kribbella sp.]|uniref:DUF4386 family protein n=1 Tax=Kribbella sp. TaxID=1871183 RepID=UPI002D78D677|nr:hypothetical protein [Kribbella sp.]HET6295849.1 hypothetical protein [Kribbella sp.]
MTTTAVRPSSTGRDARTASRWLAAIVLPVGPAAIALLRYFLPYDTIDDSSTIVSKTMADQDRASLVLWLGFIAILTLVPAAFAVGRLTRRRAPWLTAVALFLLVPGYLSLGWLTGGDISLWAGPESGLDAGAVTRLYDTMHPTTDLAGVFFVVGHVLGTILLGIAMWRSRVVAKWAALAVIVSQPIHFVAAVIVPNHTVDLIGWGLQAAGFAAVGWAILRMRDNEWDPPAVP